MTKGTRDEITDEELTRIERELADVWGQDHCDVADFATRNLARMLSEVRRLRAKLGTPVQSKAA